MGHSTNTLSESSWTNPNEPIGVRSPALGTRPSKCTPNPLTNEEPKEIVGRSATIGLLRRRVAAIARADSSVLLTGETGTGKGLVARAIHRLSKRASAPFVHVDCAALASSVIESELFGHERGAFTGAVERRVGRFELAKGGTLFLDEIGDLEPGLQAKLLRVLHDREYERVGSNRTLSMSARIIAATNRNLHEAMRDGSFRSDLFFRLKVFQCDLPPLRDHPEDVAELFDEALRCLCDHLNLKLPRLTERSVEQLAAYRWPGNVRELFNVAERLLVVADGSDIDEFLVAEVLEDESEFWTEIPRKAPTAGRERSEFASPPADPMCRRDDPERVPEESCGAQKPAANEIAAVLNATGGNVARAARRLNMARSTLRYQIRRHNLAELIPND